MSCMYMYILCTCTKFGGIHVQPNSDHKFSKYYSLLSTTCNLKIVH